MSAKMSNSRRINLNPHQKNSNGILKSKLTRVLAIAGVGLVIATLVLATLVFHRSAVLPVHADSSAVQRVQSKLQQVRTAVASGQPQVLSLDTNELNSLIESKLVAMRAGNPSSRVRALSVQLLNDRISIHLGVSVYGEEMTLDIAGTLHTRDGYVEFNPVSGRIGAAPIPERALTAAVQQAMSTPANHRDMKLPANISDLRVESSKLVATYR